MKDHPKDLSISRRAAISSVASLLFALPAQRALAGLLRPTPKFDPKYELAVDVEIAPQEGFRTHRPYVAVWVEDKDGKSVRTLSLWVETDRRGPRWIPDLRRWWRDAQSPATAAGGDLIQTTSSATRNPGKYQVVWDGKNDKGALVDQGEYTLFIEAAREHGTYQLVTQKLRIGKAPFKARYDGNPELAGGTIDLRKRS